MSDKSEKLYEEFDKFFEDEIKKKKKEISDSEWIYESIAGLVLCEIEEYRAGITKEVEENKIKHANLSDLDAQIILDINKLRVDVSCFMSKVLLFTVK